MLAYTVYELFTYTKLLTGGSLLNIHGIGPLVAGIEMHHPTPFLPVTEEGGICLISLNYRINKGGAYADTK